MFEEFRQVGRNYTSKQEGTGLGLALTTQIRRAARRPDRRRERARQGLDLHIHTSGEAMKLILIVEDNDKNLKLVRDVLQVKGYETIEAGTAEDGIVLARERKPDLILMDIQLPGMNGIEALGVLRAEPATAAIPVVAVTASVMQQDRKHDHRGRLRRLHRQADQPQGIPGHRASTIAREKEPQQ